MFEQWLLSMGYSVFPLAAGSKRPDADTLAAWGLDGKWKTLQSEPISPAKIWPKNRNVGVVTGNVSGIVVVDFDDHASWTDYQKLLGKSVGSGMVVETKRGFHAYFKHPGYDVGNSAKVKGSYDIRGDGGYVVGPTSVVDGFEYRVLFGNLNAKDAWPVFDCEQWLEPKSTVAIQGPRSVSRWDRYRSAVIDGEFERVSQSVNGTRHDTLKTAAIKLGSYVGGGCIDQGECVGILFGAAKVCGLPEQESRACIAAGISIGKQNPRSWVEG